MNLRSLPNFASAAALAAVMQMGTSAAHASAAPAVALDNNAVIQQAQPVDYEWTEEKRMQLRRAYWLLEHANANYEGHKVKAMEHIKKLGERYGIDLHGKGYEGPHRQDTSDERLRQAKAELQKFLREGVEHPKELERIDDAIREINHALKVN